MAGDKGGIRWYGNLENTGVRGTVELLRVPVERRLGAHLVGPEAQPGVRQPDDAAVIVI